MNSSEAVGMDLATLAAPFRGKCPPVRKSPLYLVALFAVAGLMVVLPVIYLALVFAVGAATVWHAVNDIGVFESARGAGSAKAAFLVYVGPLIAGTIATLFMIKPLFAPRAERPEPCTLRPNEEPLLFGYVEALCAYMNAPAPRRIDVDCDVNASASFRRGFISLAGNDLVLTVGLPLAAGLSLRDLTGVLAHELGHFAQGSGMRLGYVIARINRWFARVAYERDAWDEKLDEWRSESGHALAAVIVWMAIAFVWLSRLVLRALMYVGLFFSSMLARQQEYDADRWAARVSGSSTFASTALRLLELEVASGPTFREIAERWRTRTLPDNLVHLLLSNERGMPAALRSDLKKHLQKQRTGVFDTHPSFNDRERSVQKAAEPGVFTLDAPATVLFRDFTAVCRRASYLHYRAVVGEQIFDATLVPTQGIVAQAEVRREQAGALDTFLAGIIAVARPPVLPAESAAAPSDPRAALARLKEVRRELAKLAPGAVRASNRYARAQDRWAELRSAEAVHKVGLVFVAPRFHVPDRKPETVQVELRKAVAEVEEAAQPLEKAAVLMGERIHLCLSLLSAPGADARIPGAEKLAARADELLPTYRALSRVLGLLEPWERRVRVIPDLFKSVTRENEKEKTIAACEREMAGAAAVLAQVRDTLSQGLFAVGDQQLDLCRLVAGKEVLSGKQIGKLLPALENASTTAGATFGTVLTELCASALTLENALGLKPLLPAPKEMNDAPGPS